MNNGKKGIRGRNPLIASLLLPFCILPVSCKSGEESSAEAEVPVLMYTVPSDAVGVMNFEKGLSSMAEILDSNSVFLTLDYGRLENSPMTVSYNYTGQLHQLLAVDCAGVPADSLESARNLRASADSAGLGCRFVSLADGQRNAVLISRSENVLDAAQRHISQGTSILDAGGSMLALEAAGGESSSMFFPNREVSKLPLDKAYIPFLKGFSQWTVLSGRGHGEFDVTCIHDGNRIYYAALLDAQKTSQSRLASLLRPEFDFVLSLQINSIGDYLASYREYLDAHTLLRKFDENCADACNWARNGAVREVAKLSGNEREYLALRCSRNQSEEGIRPNPAVGYPARLFGKAFGLRDESCCLQLGEWMLVGSSRDLEAYMAARTGECSLTQLWPQDGVKAAVYVSKPEPLLVEVCGKGAIKVKKLK